MTVPSRQHGEFAAFNRDVDRWDGYAYTSNGRLSSQLANHRLTEAALRAADLTGKRVLDIGCGDGTYSLEVYEPGRPAFLHGVDAAASAVEAAAQKTGSRHMQFSVASAYELPFAADSFDIAQIRGVLHHLDHPDVALREALRVAAQIVVIEPNDYNPMLKMLEKFSRYHIEHGEKSFTAGCLDEWTRRGGGMVATRGWFGLVPFFCPDLMARMLKRVEPLVERVPLLCQASCAVYVFTAHRTSPPCAGTA